MQICIIGAGVTGLLLLLLLQQAQFPLSQVCIIDPFFDGGELARSWATVLSNTPWKKTTDALLEIGCTLPEWAASLPPDAPTPLSFIGRLIRELAPLGHQSPVQRIQGLVRDVHWSNSAWTIQVRREGRDESFRSTVVCFAHGAQATRLDVPIPTIPLDVALSQSRLNSYIQTSDSVVVFGTRHSGTLVLKNLLQLAPRQITAVYKGKQPFSYAEEGDYDGLKLEAADFARGLSNQSIVQLLALDDFSAVSRAVQSATWVIYAIGFKTTESFRIQVDGHERFPDAYDGTTGRILNAQNAWGFGIGYPSQAPDGIHWDVGIASFVEHMSRQVRDIIGAATSK